MFMAERQGFEPWNTREDVTGIPVQRLRPLGHLSKTFVRSAESLVEGDPDWNRPARYSARPVLRPFGADCRAMLANRSSSLPANLVDRSATSPKLGVLVYECRRVTSEYLRQLSDFTPDTSFTSTPPAPAVRRAFYQANSIPAAWIASRTWAWKGLASGVKGRRVPSLMRPMRARAHLTGIGLDSRNRAR